MPDTNARFEAVVLPHLDSAFGLARWLTGNATDAEDVVQDACLRALKGIDGFCGQNARAWTLAIVRNTAMSWLARNRPRALVLTDDMEAAERSSSHAPEGPNPEDALIAKADAAALEAAICALPLHLRETFVLRDIHEMSYRDIAAMTQVAVGTVMSRLARARASLVQTLGVRA